MIDVSVIVPARDAAATIGRTMEALAAQRFDGNYEVILVDNGSLDDTAAIAEGSALRPTVIRRSRGEGPGAARNAGAARATGAALAFTDGDCEPEPGWLAAGVAALAAAELAQGEIRPAGPVGPFDRTLQVTEERGLYETANLFLQHDLFQRLGGFDDWVEDGAEAFGEDALLGWRARREGARTAFARDAVVRHAVFPRGPGGYIAERARLRFFPLLASRIPELRSDGFFARVFLNRRSAAFDLGLVGVLAAAVLASPLLVLAAAPYAWILARGSRRTRPTRMPAVAVVDLAADAVGFASLVRGSVAHRSLLL